MRKEIKRMDEVVEKRIKRNNNYLSPNSLHQSIIITFVMCDKTKL